MFGGGVSDIRTHDEIDEAARDENDVHLIPMLLIPQTDTVGTQHS